MGKNEKIMSEIKYLTSEFFGIEDEDLLERNRKKEVVEARRFLHYYLYENFGIGYSEQMRFFYYNHATIIHAINKHRVFLNTEKLTAEKYSKYCKFIKNAFPDVVLFETQECLHFVKLCMPEIEKILKEKYELYKKQTNEKN